MRTKFLYTILFSLALSQQAHSATGDLPDEPRAASPQLGALADPTSELIKVKGSRKLDETIPFFTQLPLELTLKVLSFLSKKDFAQLRLTSSGWGAYLKATQFSKIKRLHFLSNKIGNAGVIALAPYLSQMTNLQSLDLRGNYIGDDGVIALAPNLSRMPNLQSLILESNQIGAACRAEILTRLTRPGLQIKF
ncbi:MAG: F-box-like domain-containing protein [Alphaproteobacteria bacterium]